MPGSAPPSRSDGNMAPLEGPPPQQSEGSMAPLHPPSQKPSEPEKPAPIPSLPSPTAPQQAEVLPQFPWPPPQASARTVLPALQTAGGASPKTFGDIDAVLSSALLQTGYGDKGYYAVPGGFAVAARMEQIYANGRSMPPPARFSLSPPVPPVFSLDYFKGLFIARNGYFRVVVFIVSGQPFTLSASGPSEAEATGWPHGGANALPIAVASMPLATGYDVTALIYEFQNSTAGDSRKFILLSPQDQGSTVVLLSGIDHLRQSGLWDALGLR
jgi:hypothetical protein